MEMVTTIANVNPTSESENLRFLYLNPRHITVADLRIFNIPR